jgi:hypothetical protein
MVFNKDVRSHVLKFELKFENHFKRGKSLTFKNFDT